MNNIIGHLATKVNLVLMGEYGTDPDEQLSLILAGQYQHFGLIELLGVNGNHRPAGNRARSAKRTLTYLGLGHVPVGKGEDGWSASSTAYETDLNFLALETQIEHGRTMLRRMLQCSEDHSVVLVLNSGFMDVVWLWKDDPQRFLDKVHSVVLMSGIETDGDQPRLSPEGFLQPSVGKGGAANNCFDVESTRFIYGVLQRFGVPMTITTRFAAYQAKVPWVLYEDLAATGHPLGTKIRTSAAEAIQGLWEKVNAPAGSELRGSLPTDRNQQWFGDTFAMGIIPPIAAEKDVTPHIVEIALYDLLNTLAAIPSLAGQFFEAHEVTVPSSRGPVIHRVIGVSEQLHGVSNPTGLKRLLRESLVNALLQHPVATPAIY